MKTLVTPQRGPQQRTCVPYFSIAERNFIRMSYSLFASQRGRTTNKEVGNQNMTGLIFLNERNSFHSLVHKGAIL